MIKVSKGYSLAVRFNKQSPTSTRKYPIVIPNGLAATIAHTGRIHDSLVSAGFTVLSYDRLGVGFSDANQTGRSPTVDECDRDMDEIMESVLPGSKWILFGPSMGSVVAQCYLLRHPEKVVGFVNLDGVPAPFTAKDKEFMQSAMVYKVANYLVVLGIVRPFFMLAGSFFNDFASPTFPANCISAMMNLPNFWYNTGLEFRLMMDQAKEANEGWGSLDVLKMTQQQRDLLSGVRPANNGEFKNGNWIPLAERSAAEKGNDWNSDEKTQQIIDFIDNNIEHSPLGTHLSHIPVRIMSARDYNYVGGDSFYKPEMKEWAACEHNVQALVCKERGKRYVFPRCGHNNLFLENEAATQCCVEVDNDIQSYDVI